LSVAEYGEKECLRSKQNGREEESTKFRKGYVCRLRQGLWRRAASNWCRTALTSFIEGGGGGLEVQKLTKAGQLVQWSVRRGRGGYPRKREKRNMRGGGWGYFLKSLLHDVNFLLPL